MSDRNPRVALFICETIGTIAAVMQIGLLSLRIDIDTETKAYIIAGLGILAVLIPLIALGSRARELKAFGVAMWAHCAAIGFLSVCTNIVAFLTGDMLTGGLVLVLHCFLWYFAAYGNGWHRKGLHEMTTILSRSCVAFFLLFMPAYLFYVPLRSLEINVVPVWDAAFDVLVGIGIMCFLIFAWLVAKYRANFVSAVVLLVMWYQIETGWIMRNWDRLLAYHVGTMVFAIGVLMVLAINAAFSIGRFLGDTILLADTGRSGLLGPWFSPVFARRGERKLGAREMRAVKRGLAIAAVLIAISAPGMAVAFGWAPYPVTITPRDDYTMRFSFWADSNASKYSPEVQAELDEHHANLDLGGDVSTLLAIEAAMPNVTYRVVFSPPDFSQLAETLVQRTEAILPYEANGSLNQWRGFAFDIEGTSFGVGVFDNVDDAVAEWNAAFDYIYNNASPRRPGGKVIEMENVGSHVFGVDLPFDGDMDSQLIEGYVSNVPVRFTSYAPMIYRCLSSDKTATTEPYSMFSPWATSYSVYDSLYTLSNTVKNETRLGVYLGVTNDSCYSRDLPQPDPITWGEAGGFGNLIRDTLIAKHFGVPEVTFFLQFSVTSQGCNCPEFGAFDSYGIDFLDVMNDSVNTSPPRQFTIYYNDRDAALSTLMYRDVLGNVSHPVGAMLVVAAMAGSLAVTVLVERRSKRGEPAV